MIKELLTIVAIVAVAASLVCVGAEVAARYFAIQSAYRTALTLGGVPEATYPRPLVRIDGVRYIGPAGIRLCGRSQMFMLGDDLQVNAVVEVFIRPGERRLRRAILIHEFLHYIWWKRAMADPAWYRANPDSEEWVRALFPAVCPEI